MERIARILAPVDFSERCLGMMPYARTLAKKYNAEIILLHVVNPVFITPEVGMAPPAAIAVPQWLVTEKNKLLEEFAAGELAGLRVRRLVYEGIPEMQIVEIAQSEKVQLILMPTHGYGVFRRFLIGSVTAKVLDDVPIPVFTGIHMEQHVHDAKEEFSCIACAIDLKLGSSQTLLTAAKLAQDFDSKLGVIHVSPDPGQGATNPSDLQPQLEELVSNELAKNSFSFAPERLASSVQSGDTAQTICGFAERIGAKLLVVGRDHLGGSGGQHETGRLRTHTYSIIRQAPCPVLSL